MGVFLAASGVIDCPTEALNSALSALATQAGGVFAPPGPDVKEDEKTWICSLGERHLVVYGKGFLEWDQTSASLSLKRSSAPSSRSISMTVICGCSTSSSTARTWPGSTQGPTIGKR